MQSYEYERRNDATTRTTMFTPYKGPKIFTPMNINNHSKQLNENDHSQLQRAFNVAVGELRLGEVDIRIGINQTLDCLGEVTEWTYDVPYRDDYYVIELKADQYWPVTTLGHELYHIWEMKNDQAPCEYLCDAFGIKVEGMVGAEPRCSICNRTMGHLEAEESLHGVEFTDELICDKCFTSAPEV